MTLSAGTRLGPYEMLVPLGSGGMGEVWLARDVRLERRVAVKLLHRDLSHDPERLARFEREARAAASISHPNVVALHDVGEFGGRPWIVTEMLEGETLRDRMRLRPLGVREALSIASQAARGLAAAHRKGLVHRDLKPENVFLCRDGLVKVLDFGLVRVEAPSAPEGQGAVEREADLGTEAWQTSTGLVVGTPGYMSPEQARGDAVDARSDLFSLGTVLFEMLTGDRPFRGATAVDEMSAVLKQAVPPPSSLVPALPPGIDAVVGHALEKQPEERFQTALDLAFALESLARAGGSGGANALASGARGGAAAPPRRLGRMALSAGLAAGTLLLLAAAYRAGGKSGPAQAPTFRQLTFGHGSVLSARFASGGDGLVYTAAWDGGAPETYSAPLDEASARPLGLAGSTVFAVRGTEAAILRDLPPGPASGVIGRSEARGGTLARVPLSGGTPREVLENVLDADWSPDGDSYCIVRRGNGVDRLEYPAGRLLCEGAGYLESPRISPDGRSVAFLEHPFATDSQGVVSLVDASGRKTVLAGGWTGELSGLAWDPSGRRLFFTGSRSGPSREIWSVTRGGSLQLVHRFPGRVALLDAAKGKLLVTQSRYSSEAYGTVPADPATPAGPAGPAGSSGAAERSLTWLDWTSPAALSPDGRLFLFYEGGDGGGPRFSVFLQRLPGGRPVRLGEGAAVSLSPDGLWALALLRETPRLVAYPTGAGQPVPLPLGSLEAAHWAAFFPDGRRILVLGNQPGRPQRLFVQAFPSGEPRPIAPEGVVTRSPAISPDGAWVAAVGRGGDRYSLYPVGGGPAREVPGLGAGEEPLSFSEAGDALFVREAARRLPARVSRLSLSDGRRTPWLELAPPDRAGVGGVARILLTPDGRSHAFRVFRLLSELYLVELPGL